MVGFARVQEWKRDLLRLDLRVGLSLLATECRDLFLDWFFQPCSRKARGPAQPPDGRPAARLWFLNWFCSAHPEQLAGHLPNSHCSAAAEQLRRSNCSAVSEQLAAEFWLQTDRQPPRPCATGFCSKVSCLDPDLCCRRTGQDHWDRLASKRPFAQFRLYIRCRRPAVVCQDRSAPKRYSCGRPSQPQLCVRCSKGRSQLAGPYGPVPFQ